MHWHRLLQVGFVYIFGFISCRSSVNMAWSCLRTQREFLWVSHCIWYLYKQSKLIMLILANLWSCPRCRYDHDNKRPRGFGFVTFVNEEGVDAVFTGGSLQTLHDKPIEIKRAVPRDQIASARGRPGFAQSPRLFPSAGQVIPPLPLSHLSPHPSDSGFTDG